MLRGLVVSCGGSRAAGCSSGRRAPFRARGAALARRLLAPGIAAAIFVASPLQAQLALPGWAPPEPVAPLAAPDKPKPKPKPKQDAAGPVKAPGEDAALDRTLLQNGGQSRLELEKRDGKIVATKLSLVGLSTKASGQVCKIDATAAGPLPAAPLGRASGLSRFELPVEGCKMAFDVIEGAVLMDGSAGVCEFRQADCRVDVGGMWGPPASALTGQARDIEKARGQAEQTLRGNFKLLSQRAVGKEAVKLVAREQAAFTSEREMVCRFYDKENTHGFCGARYTQARAAQLWARINGVKPETQAAEGAPTPRKPRPKPRRDPAPAPALAAPQGAGTSLY